jgi:hypothetical protein
MGSGAASSRAGGSLGSGAISSRAGRWLCSGTAGGAAELEQVERWTELETAPR